MIGKTRGHYRIVEQIGAGGMGVVYRARDERLDRDVALKVLPAGLLADEAARKRFRKEALTLSQLNHPNIAVVHDFDTQDGVDFLVTELIPGETLAAKLAGGALPEKEILALGAQVAAALEEAHDRGVVHRDLKPGNIIVTPKGQAKVLDFGLARLAPAGDADLTRSLTETHAVTGTLPYMAPEQLRGEPADVRTDLWALGCVPFEMATGQRPFDAKLATALAADIQHKPPAAPRQLNPQITARLEDVILKCLEKEPGNRYQSTKELAVDLRRLSSPTAPVTAAPPAPPRAGKAAQWPLWAQLLVAALGVPLILGVVWITSRGKTERERLRQAASAPKIESLAVLPLENLSRDPEQEYFADGMTEALITELSKISALKVISRTSVMQHKGAKKPLPQIARELGVDGVIEGSVVREGDQVRITVQLIHGATDKHLWAESYQREMRSILALQGEVARALAGEIRVKLTPQEQARLAGARAVNPEAHEAYLKGRYYTNKFTEEGVKKGIEHFQHALEVDPNSALAYAGLADAYYGLSNIYLSPKEVMPKAEEAAMKALKMDDTLAEAHTSMGMIRMYYHWNWLDAEREFKRAIQLNANYATAHLRYGILLTETARFGEAIRELRHAQQLDPLSLEGNAFIGLHFVSARQYDQAVQELQKAIELEPDSWIAHQFLGTALELKGELAKALRELQKATHLDDNPSTLSALAHAHLASGNRGEAMRILDKLEGRSKHRYISPYFVAIIYVGLGDQDQAFTSLEETYADRNEMLGWLKVDPLMDKLRSDPRFQDLLRRMNFPP